MRAGGDVVKRTFSVVVTMALVVAFVSATDAYAAKKPTVITVNLSEFT